MYLYNAYNSVSFILLTLPTVSRLCHRCARLCFQRVAKRDLESKKSEKRWDANIYSAAMNRGIQKRATTAPPKLTCDLFLQSDPKLWDYMTKSRSGGGLGYVSWYLCFRSIPDFSN